MIPEELLSSILSLLSRDQLASIARVRKSFCRIVQPLLYGSIELRAQSEVFLPRATNPAAQYRSCHLLCRTIRECQQPITSLIRKLTMEARHPSIFLELCSTSESQNLMFPMLTTLVLRHAQIQVPTLRKLLAMMPRLEALNCDFECDAEPRDPYHAMYLDCGELGAALQMVQETLVELQVSVGFVTSAALEIDNGGSLESGDGWGIKERLGASLKTFGRLRSLDVPWSVLLGWLVESRIPLAECLPQELQTLVLSHDLGYFVNYEWDNDSTCVGSLLEYLEICSRRGELQNLKVRFSGDYEDEERPTLDQALWGKVDEKCKEIGCQLQLEGRDL